MRGTDKFLKWEFPTNYSLADAIETTLKWVYAVEKGSNKEIQDWIEEGRKAIVDLNFIDALYRYDKALELDSKNEFAMYEKGRAYFLQNDNDQALQWFNRILEINPNHSGALVEKVLVLRKKQGLDKELIADPENYDKAYLEDFSEDRNLVRALESLEKDLASNPKDYTKLYQKGELLLVSGTQTEAQESFDRAIEINNNHDLCWHLKGVVYFSQRRYEEALKCFDTAIEINSRLAEVIYHRGMVRKFARRNEEEK